MPSYKLAIMVPSIYKLYNTLGRHNFESVAEGVQSGNEAGGGSFYYVIWMSEHVYLCLKCLF